MISAAEARQFSNNDLWKIQLEEIEQGVKQTLLRGGTYIFYKTEMLREDTIEQLRKLGYKVEVNVSGGWLTHDTKISWKESIDENK